MTSGGSGPAPSGVRASLPLLLPTAGVGVSFGLLAEPLVGGPLAVLMSAVVWSGTAQFAALSVLAAGAPAAAAAGLLANTRFLPMGFAVAPAVRGGPLRRVGVAATIADASFVIAHRGGGRFDVRALVWAAPVQYVGWVGGTALGVLGARALSDPQAWGLDVFFPVFYLSLLLPELIPLRPQRARDPLSGSESRPRRGRALLVAALAAAITLALTPVTPPGVAVFAAAATALIGLLPTRPRRAAT